MKLTPSLSERNFYSFLWHAGFFAIASNFIDTDTIIPAMLVDAGGTAIHIGILTTIMLGGSSFTQLIFAPFISNYPFKKKFLLLGINARILSLLALGVFLLNFQKFQGNTQIGLIFALITIFSLGGAFANISYTDILGKSLLAESRKHFFSIRQVITGILIVGSVFVARKVLSSANYPNNYAYMFFAGFLILGISSVGFWNIKEVVPSKLQVRGPVHFIQLIKQELKENKKLGYFLGFINTQGIAISLLPFVILYAKEMIDLQSENTGNYLLFKMVGIVFTGLMLLSLRRKYKYRYLLYLNASLSILLILIILVFSGNLQFRLIFFIGGTIFAIYGITMNGVLLEVSENSNRALYAGIAGAGNIIPALFPLLGGWVIKLYGFQIFFMLFILVILLSFYFIHNLKCKF